MSHDLHKRNVRDALKPRITKKGRPSLEPYWGAPLAPGRFIGYRVIEGKAPTWIARARAEDGGQKYNALKVKDVNDYAAAVAAAREWFDKRDAGVSDEAPTVETVCKEYVEDRRTEKGEATAYDAEIRFKRSVYVGSDAKHPAPIGNVRLDKLKTARLKDWRNGIAGGKASQDREFRSLKAALNLAVVNRRVSPGVAIEWRSVKQHKGADGRRDLFLDRKQRNALLDACVGSMRDLVEAAIHTGARPGELIKLTRADFDARTKDLRVPRGQGSKTGYRKVPLTPAAVTFFARVAKDKLPAAPLLTDDAGQPWRHHADWAALIRAAAQRAKLPAGVVLYTLRHSWITEALRGGMATLDVARLTGTSLQMIEKHYGHLVQGAARDRLAKVRML
jgi:integrase